MSIAHTLTLDYKLQAGWLEPFVHGLQNGLAIGRCCNSCEKVSFPPVRSCQCSHGLCSQDMGTWITLSGIAQIVHRCDGSDGSFALVQFEGADTLTVVRLQDMDARHSTGTLIASGIDKPAMIIRACQRSDSVGSDNSE